MMKLLTNVTAILVAALAVTPINAQDNSDWYRQTAISPDGASILFSYQGDIYTVSSKGGDARLLTIHGAWDGHPVWSRDGKHVAFASDRHGNLDVFVMPADGGKATRLTHHSTNDIPTDFTTDNGRVLFTSARTESAKSSIFPTGRLGELYEVAISGGTPRMVSTVPSSEARYSKDGNQILYRDEKAYENDLRKHDTSAFARDLWIHDLKSGSHIQLTTFKGGDHTPVWDGKDGIYYLSEDGENNFNVWHMDTSGKNNEQISNFSTHPVRHLSISNGGVLAYTQHGSLFTQVPGQEPQRLEISFRTDSQTNDYISMHLKKRITEFALSPNGKEVAFVARGEVFVTSRDFSTTKRITNTPEQERSVSFHKDGRTLLYAGERGDKWKLYESSIGDKKEEYFFASTKLLEKEILATDKETFQPLYSPDGTKIAYLSGRDEIQVLDRESGDTHVALKKEYNYSYTDGDITFAWSPDGKWLVSDYAARDRLFVPNIGIFPADGSAAPVDISHSGYQDGSPSWGKSGDVIYWTSARYGQRDHGSWGTEFDIMAAFLTQDAYDKFTLSKEEYELAKDLKKQNEKSKGKDDQPNEKTEDEKKTVAPTSIEWEGLDDRVVRLTRNSSNIQSAVLTKDSNKLFYLTSLENGHELWELDFREDSTKRVTKLGPGNVEFQLSNDEKGLFILANDSLSHAVPGEKYSPKPIAFNAVMELKPGAERAFIFEHTWRKIKDKFYNPNFHGIDWDAMKTAYQAKLPSIANNRDLANLLAELTGELNASHIGVSYRPTPSPESDKTASLGVIFDLKLTSGPLTIAEILDKSPLKKAKSSVKAGMKLTAVDGVTLGEQTNLARLLNNKTDRRVRLSITREDGTKFDEVIKPISIRAESELMYERWVKNRRTLVDELSEGRLGYVHIRGMNDESFRVAYSEILGRNFGKEAIVVDTRWNGGGWLHNDLAKLLMGKEYFTMHVRGREYRGDSIDQWNKPSILVMGEGNYSDAHAFPFTYNTLKIGEMVGMPVPGTMTAVWWETMISGDVRVGVPQVGMKNKQGEYLENNQTEPDHLVKNDPQSSAEGKDKQIAKAVEVMLRSLDAQKKD